MDEKESSFDTLAASPNSRAHAYRADGVAVQPLQTSSNERPAQEDFTGNAVMFGGVFGAMGALVALAWCVSAGLHAHLAPLPTNIGPSTGAGVAALVGKAFVLGIAEFVAHMFFGNW